MSDQLDFFAQPAASPPSAPAPARPEGFRYQPHVITSDAERDLLAQIEKLPFKEFEFHGYVGKRRTVSFGAHYDFSTESLRPSATPSPSGTLRPSIFLRLPS